jgi:hypothetical protein
MTDDERRAIYANLRATYEMHFAYFENKGPVSVRGRETRSLNLPAAVLDKFYAANARAW